MKKLGMFAVAMLIGSAAKADVSGFVDAQFNWSKEGDADPTSGFMVHEAAIYMKGKMAGGSYLVDLPFAAVTGTTTATNSFTVAQGKAQAYVGYGYGNGFSWKLGQFDMILGAEAKDTVGTHFAHQSHIDTEFGYYSTHTGLDVTYAIDTDWALDLFVANNIGAGVSTSSENMDFGGKLSGKMADAGIEEISVGGYYSKVGDSNTMFLSGTLGFKFGEIELRGDGTYKKPDGADAAMGMSGWVAYDMGDMAWAARFGIAKNLSDTKMEVDFGPSFQMAKNLTAKLDYSFEKSPGDASVTSHGINVAAVMTF